MIRTRAASVAPTALLVLVLLVVAVLGVWGLLRASSRAGTTASPAATGSPSGGASAAPTPVGGLPDEGLRTYAVGLVPADHRFVVVGDTGAERLLLLDLNGRRILEVAGFDGLGSFPRGRSFGVASVRDATVLVILLSSDDAPSSKLIVLRPATGGVHALTLPRSDSPRLHPDGRTLAVAREGDPAQRGLWLVDLSDGSERRLIADGADVPATRPIGWSADGSRLAVVASRGRADETVRIVDPASGALTVVGAGASARWRGSELLFWSPRLAAGVAVHDAATGTRRPAYPRESGTYTEGIEPRPSSSDVAALEQDAKGTRRLVLHGTERAAATLQADASRTIAFWWSPDGARLYLWWNDNGTTTVTELLTDTNLLQLCLRTRIAPPCP